MPSKDEISVDDGPDETRCEDIEVERTEDYLLMRWKLDGVQYERKVPALHTLGTVRPTIEWRRPRKSTRQLAEEAEAARLQSQNQGTVQTDTMKDSVDQQGFGGIDEEPRKIEDFEQQPEISRWPEERLGMLRFERTPGDCSIFVAFAATRDMELLQQQKLSQVDSVREATFRSQPDHPGKTIIVTPDTKTNTSNSLHDNDRKRTYAFRCL